MPLASIVLLQEGKQAASGLSTAPNSRRAPCGLVVQAWRRGFSTIAAWQICSAIEDKRWHRLFDDSLLVPSIWLSGAKYDIKTSSRVTSSRREMKLYNAHIFVDNCGSFTMERLQELSASSDGTTYLLTCTQVLKSVGHMSVDLVVSRIDLIQAE